MLSLEDCLDFSDLSPLEIEAIASHEHVPLIVAAEIGCSMLQTPSGVRGLETIFLETAETARARGSLDDARRFIAIYRQFHRLHPGS